MIDVTWCQKFYVLGTPAHFRIENIIEHQEIKIYLEEIQLIQT